MPECFACHQEIPDPKDHDVLEITGTNDMDSDQLFHAFGYTPRIKSVLNRSYIHFRCVSNIQTSWNRGTGTSCSNGEWDNLNRSRKNIAP